MSKPPPLSAEHICRVSALEDEKRWVLQGDTLWVSSGKYPPMSIPLASLAQVRLIFAPSRVQRNRYQCRLKDVRGQKWKFQNEHFRGVMDFEGRSGSYLALVRLLASRTAAVNPVCRFVSGAAWWSWLLQTGLLGGMLILLIVVFITMGAAVTGLIIVKLLIILFYVPTAFSWIRKNKPRGFHPLDMPPAILPEMK